MEISLYIHIPFCDSKCGYCAFNSKINKNHLKDDYMKYISSKLQTILKINSYKITSVYIGGGTPSSVDFSLYDRLFEVFMPYVIDNSEINIEANPNSCSKEWISHLQLLGVNRLSLGVQSFFDSKLEYLQRDHKKDSIYHAIDFAVNAGISNISIDLIYGTPFCDDNLLLKEVELAIKLPINHLSAYQLSIDPGSKFATQSDKTEYVGEFCGFDSIGHFIKDALNRYGFVQYEVSNYGRLYDDKHYISKHNMSYWLGNDYLGIGAGAVSCINGIRYYEESKIESYLSGKMPNKEVLTQQDISLERLFLGFRSCSGVDEVYLDKHKCDILLKERKVYKVNNRYFAMDYFLGDELALFFN